MSTSCLEQMTGWPVIHKACVTPSSLMDTERLVLLQVHVVSSTLTSQLLTSKVYIWHKRVHEHVTQTRDTNEARARGTDTYYERRSCDQTERSAPPCLALDTTQYKHTSIACISCHPSCAPRRIMSAKHFQSNSFLEFCSPLCRNKLNCITLERVLFHSCFWKKNVYRSFHILYDLSFLVHLAPGVMKFTHALPCNQPQFSLREYSMS